MSHVSLFCNGRQKLIKMLHWPLTIIMYLWSRVTWRFFPGLWLVRYNNPQILFVKTFFFCLSLTDSVTLWHYYKINKINSIFLLFHLQLHQPSPARVTFPSPCITGTRQLTDQSSTSHPSSPPSPSPGSGSGPRPRPASSSSSGGGADPSLNLLKQYYLDCILKIDPHHPVAQTFAMVRCKLV